MLHSCGLPHRLWGSVGSVCDRRVIDGIRQSYYNPTTHDNPPLKVATRVSQFCGAKPRVSQLCRLSGTISEGYPERHLCCEPVMGPMLERPRTYLGSAQAMLDTGHIDDDNTDTWEDLHGRLEGAVRGHFG